MSSMKQFGSLEALVASLGGKRVLRRVLIANNGLAALKGIRSMRQWAYELMGDESSIQFVCMATPEDIRVNVEYIKMADETVEVPGGRNSNNYANVQLIVDTAVRTHCDAVWAGWGHASENPELPEKLKAKGIQFLGPPASAMHALGDKIASTIVAQTAGVPTIAWSGSGLELEDLKISGSTVPDSLFRKACIEDSAHCVEVCNNLQFPLMIKASEGGGGKGIRMVRSAEEVENAYHAVAGEVPGSPIFVMRLASDVRHLEVQLLADEEGRCIALKTRDCSVQRRHQKIIEEGPVVRTVPGVLSSMEKAAVRLAEMVGYRGVGTVEYLYHKGTGAFYFLELNPRLQVEHTVTELITGVNLPACMLCVGMGIPLGKIPDIRSFYGVDRFGTDPVDFTKEPVSLGVHTIACRITAENPDDGFTPTSGAIDELTFRNSKNVFGYFSISSHGGVHEFADSQFGHIFSTASTRAEAIAGMIMALKQLTIRGEIRTTKEYLLKLLDMPQFVESDICTAWLDGLIKSRLRVESPNPFLSVLCAATYKAVERYEANRAKYLSFLEAGHVPSSDLFTTMMPVMLVLDQVKYEVICTKTSPTEWMLSLCGTHIVVAYRRLADRGLLLTLEGGRSPVVYAEEDAACLRVTIDGRTATFTHEVDPTKLRSQMPGKLVRYLVKEGDFVDAHTPFCEIEVMKMYLQLKTAIAGTITFKGQPGTTVHAGKILAVIEPEDPDSIVRAEENKKPWPPIALMWSGGQTPPPSPRLSTSSGAVPKAKKTLELCHNLIMGYDLPKDVFESSLSSIAEGLQALAEPEVTIFGLLPWISKGTETSELERIDGPKEGRARIVHCIRRLCESFLAVDSLYEGGKLQQEVVDGLRSERQDSGRLEEVFDIQLAHAGQHRYRVLAALMKESESMAEGFKDILQRIASLSNPKASMIVFSARHLLRKIDLPSSDLRRQELGQALALAETNPNMLQKLADQLTYGIDVICSFLISDDADHLPVATELFLRRVYAGAFDMTNFTCSRMEDERKQWIARWKLRTKASENPLKHDGITGATSAEDLEKLALEGDNPESANGVLVAFDSVVEVRSRLGTVLKHLSLPADGDDTILKVLVRERVHQHGVLCQEFSTIVSEQLRLLQSTTITRITFVVVRSGASPLYYTYRRSLGFSEDTTYRHIAPTLAYMLELPKLQNYNIQLYQGNPVNQVHVYVAKEKSGARPKPVPVRPRLFVRALVLPSDIPVGQAAGEEMSDLTMYDAERVVASCIHALEIATSDKNLEATAANHIFIAFEGLKTEYNKIEQVVQKITEVHSAPLVRLGIIEVEIKLFCLLPGSEKPVMMRLFISNPTTHSLVMESYIEVEDSQAPGKSVLLHVTPEGSVEEEVASHQADQSSLSTMNIGKLDVPTPIFRSNSIASLDDLASSGMVESPTMYRLKIRTSPVLQELGSKKQLFWHHQPPLTPYPLLDSQQLRRLVALQNGTVYAYDWVAMFKKYLQSLWSKIIKERTDLSPSLEQSMPSEVMTAQELVYSKGILQTTLRKPGENRVGMVAWKVTMYHPSHYVAESGTVTPRTIYIVANDITVMSGSFSTHEDELFAAIAHASRIEHVPLVYLSSNSGARIGLDPELKKLFKVKQSNDPSKLFDYLYLDNDTFEAISSKKGKIVECEPVMEEGGSIKHHRITAIIGEQWGLGVENLSGSGLIAGEMAKCYDAIPTISVASGRTVGIGAYLVRLGRRVVQTKGSPIILTGNNALNKLLGKEVYTSNSQLGGTNIMGPNGVSHWVVGHNHNAVSEVMTWLDYVPDTVDLSNPVLPKPTISRINLHHDPVDRDVQVCTSPNTPYDVRMLIEGTIQDGEYRPGLFDVGSFQETQKDWAKTVVVGRARLGEIPVGVIGVETRAINKFNPADPADPTSVSAMTQQAGMVWYPDSARKTADFLGDLHREDLPAIILANWRGFSGGMRDMFDEVLKFGADIVQNLTHYRQPITVYIPPNGELRGGAWVVVDPTINKRCIEMYADPTARGGVLEPSGIIEIKYRDREIFQTIDRLDPECQRLAAQLQAAEGHLKSYLERCLRTRREVLHPIYKAVAVEFADLHDRPGRMLAVKSIDGIVDWKNARRFLHNRIKRRLFEMSVKSSLAAVSVSVARQTEILSEWFANYQLGLQITGKSHPSREARPQPTNDEEITSWATATDVEKCEFFLAIAGSETDMALEEISLTNDTEDIMSKIASNPRLAASIKELLNNQQQQEEE
eukprot:TRINITY_DN12209_c0_g1_i1.p1 TRINITY_DN12209_c0_g1~~TRINITY_DN12209_c0_g1_i1.p1  ORF type:complete len:2240 (+),score=525.55 TRINITY_DN12209_c0_g1_i1:150-6869(+)